MKITIMKYKKNPKEGKVKGFADIEMDVDGFPFTIKEVKVITNEQGGNFYALPSRSYKDDSGETKFFSLNGFFTKDGYEEFRSSMVTAFKEYFATQETREPFVPAVPEPTRQQPCGNLPF